MGLAEMNFVDDYQTNARFRGGPWVNPNKRGGRDVYEENNDLPYRLPEQPCAIQKAYENWIAAGNTGPFSIMMVCHCPRCTPRC